MVVVKYLVAVILIVAILYFCIKSIMSLIESIRDRFAKKKNPNKEDDKTADDSSSDVGEGGKEE